MKNDKECYQKRVLTLFSTLLWAVAPAATLILISTAVSEAKKPSDQDLATREYMVKISRQLGVTCNYCHDVNNFKSSKIPAFKVSKDHMRIVDLLNKQGFKGSKIQADCYMCHRGKAIPDYREPK